MLGRLGVPVGSVRTLILSGDFTERGVAALAGRTGMNLRWLALHSPHITDGAAEVLADSPQVGRLAKLILTGRRLSA